MKTKHQQDVDMALAAETRVMKEQLDKMDSLIKTKPKGSLTLKQQRDFTMLKKQRKKMYRTYKRHLSKSPSSKG